MLRGSAPGLASWGIQAQVVPLFPGADGGLLQGGVSAGTRAEKAAAFDPRVTQIRREARREWPVGQV